MEQKLQKATQDNDQISRTRQELETQTKSLQKELEQLEVIWYF
jgi:cell division protein FtsB